MDDEISMRVHSYANYYNSWAAPDTWRIDIAADAPGRTRQLLLVFDLIARTDGGDPGDED